jgi:hypothetical protein
MVPMILPLKLNSTKPSHFLGRTRIVDLLFLLQLEIKFANGLNLAHMNLAHMNNRQSKAQALIRPWSGLPTDWQKPVFIASGPGLLWRKQRMSPRSLSPPSSPASVTIANGNR